MEPIRIFAPLSWILLPTVMFGGYALLSLLIRNDAWLTSKRQAAFRAGHAHAGVLLVLSLLYYSYLAQTRFAGSLKIFACILFLLGGMAQSGGFFIDMVFDKPGSFKWGYVVSTLGALLLAFASLLLAYGLIAFFT